MTEMLMTETANPTEGDASQAPGNNSATADALYGDKQQATEGQNQQAQDDANAGNADGDQGGEEGKTEGAPEKYEFKAQDGQEFDAGIITAFSEVAKELNLSQDAAQKVLDKVAPVIQSRQSEQVETIRNEWVEQSKTDKEFGGEKLSENLSVAKKALDNFGSPELRALLNESGLGNHPEVIRFMFKAGKAISEDTFVGNSPNPGSRSGPQDFNSKAAALYSNQQSE
jgi:hypothetical protein